MDGKELRMHLEEIVKNHGIGHLRQIEVEFIQGKITYNAYLNTCYQEYCTFMQVLSNPHGQTDQRENHAQ